MHDIAAILWPLVFGAAVLAWFIHARDSRAAALSELKAKVVLELDNEAQDDLRKLHMRLTDLERQVSILNDRD